MVKNIKKGKAYYLLGDYVVPISYSKHAGRVLVRVIKRSNIRSRTRPPVNIQELCRICNINRYVESVRFFKKHAQRLSKLKESLLF